MNRKTTTIKKYLKFFNDINKIAIKNNFIDGTSIRVIERKRHIGGEIFIVAVKLKYFKKYKSNMRKGYVSIFDNITIEMIEKLQKKHSQIQKNRKIKKDNIMSKISYKIYQDDGITIKNIHHIHPELTKKNIEVLKRYHYVLNKLVKESNNINIIKTSKITTLFKKYKIPHNAFYIIVNKFNLFEKLYKGQYVSCTNRIPFNIIIKIWKQTKKEIHNTSIKNKNFKLINQ